MSFISKQFADELTEKAMRHAYLDAQTRTKLAQQVRALRIQRGWSQAELGRVLGKPQSNVHRLEDRDVARYTLTTLLELAAAYDCGLLVEFVAYEDFLRRTSDLSPRGLQVPSFTAVALEPLWQSAPAMTAPLQPQFGIASGASIPLQVAQGQFAFLSGIGSQIWHEASLPTVQLAETWFPGNQVSPVLPGTAATGQQIADNSLDRRDVESISEIERLREENQRLRAEAEGLRVLSVPPPHIIDTGNRGALGWP